MSESADDIKSTKDELFYALMSKRYASSFIDVLVVLFGIVLSVYLIPGNSDQAIRLRAVVIILLFLIYEPFMTSFFCSLGQKIMGVRVRKEGAVTARIGLVSAIVRLVLKYVLGVVSFFVVPFSKRRQAIHDTLVRSVVLDADSLERKS